jgi:hypothetical protein
MAVFQKETGTQFTLVPYSGAASEMQDLVAGQIDLVFDSLVQLPLVRAGIIRAYGVTSDARMALAPNIPTFAEMGLSALSHTAWLGLFAPKGTPAGIISNLNAATVEALADPAIRSRIDDLGFEVFPRERQTGDTARSRGGAYCEDSNFNADAYNSMPGRMSELGPVSRVTPVHTAMRNCTRVARLMLRPAS